MAFIIRNQGFFYTDEYYAPGEVFKQVVRKSFATKAAADTACATLIRKWVRAEPLGNYVFDDDVAIDKVVEYMREQWPDDDIEWDHRDLMIPDAATDKQVDAIVKRLGVTFAQVFEVDEADDDDDDEDEDSGDDEDDLDIEDEDYAGGDDLHYGPR